MALVLPHVLVDRRKRLIKEDPKGVLDKRDRALLLAIDWDLQHSDVTPGDRVIPLADDRWAVGRGTADGMIWRLVDLTHLALLQHPAWLWTEQGWFGRSGRPGPQPQTVGLKRALRQAARMTRSTRKVNALVASVIAHVRRPTRRPLALVAPDVNQLVGPGQAARWFALSLVSCMPSELSLGLRIGANEPQPDANLWDVVLTAGDAPPGFDVIEIDKAPTHIGDDLVAWYVRKRLLDGEPELVEAIAPLWDEEAEDPWKATLIRQLAAEGPSAISLDKETLVDHFPIAHELVAARVAAGSKITGRLAYEIAAITIKSGDAEIWRALRNYSARERGRAFAAWLASSTKYPPSEQLLSTIGEVRPPLTQTGAWLAGLLRWLATGNAPEAAARLLDHALREDPGQPELPSRASAFTELVVSLLRQRRPDDALNTLLGPIGQSVAEAGVSRALAYAWLLLPEAHRTQEALGAVISVLGRGEDGAAAAALLFAAMLADENLVHAELILRQWAEHRGSTASRQRDALVDRIAGTEWAELWVSHVARTADHQFLRDAVVPVIEHPRSPLWIMAEDEWARAHQPIPRDRFVALFALLPDGAAALESLGIQLLADALATTNFPDPGIAEVAAAFADGPEPSRLWMWAAVAAAEPGQYDDDTVDATVHAYCGIPPRSKDERALGVGLARRLGYASHWEPLDHARWLVRLILAPDGDASGYNHALALGMLQSMLKRSDGMDRIITIAKAIFDLPPDHEALRFFIEAVLPRLWRDGPPAEFIRQVQPHKQPTEIRSAWRAAFGNL